MAYRGKGRSGDRGNASMVNNGNGIDNFGNQNHFRNEIEELSIQVATLNDKVQLLMMKRQVATLTKKVHCLLPHGGIHDSHSQVKPTFDYKKKENIGDDLEESYGPVNPDKFEGEMNLTPDVFEEAKGHGYFNGFSIFDEYPSGELEGVLGNDCAFEIEDKFEDLPIFDESPNENFGGDLERVPVFDEFANEEFGNDFEDVPMLGKFPNEDIDDDVLSIFEEFPHEEFEDDPLFETSGDFEEVPTWDKFEGEFSGEEDEEGTIWPVNESLLTPWKDGEHILEMECTDLEMECTQYLSSNLSMVQAMQDVHVYVSSVSETSLIPLHALPKVPKEGNDYLKQLEDPLGMVFNQASLAYDPKLKFLDSMVEDISNVLGPSFIAKVVWVLIHKRHAKWVVSWHISMDAVDVHKKKLILKIGCVDGDALIKERSNMSTLRYLYFSVLC